MASGWARLEALAGAVAGALLLGAALAARAAGGAPGGGAIPPLPAIPAPPASARDGLAERVPPLLSAALAVGPRTVLVAGDAAWSGGTGCPNLGGLFCPTGGTVWVSTDGGVDWVRHDVGGGELEALAPAGPGAAYAWGPHDLVGTARGGRHWRTAALPGPGTLFWVSFASPADGWAAMQGGCTGPGICAAGLFATSDGGRSWREIAASGASAGPAVPRLPIGQAGSDIVYLGGGQGWVGGAGVGEWRTADGGRTWTAVPGSAAMPAVQAVVPGTGGVAWALEEPSAGTPATDVLATTDGGRVWRWAGTIPAAANVLGEAGGTLWALGAPQTGIAGDGAVLRSTDGGRNWLRSASAGLSFDALAPLGRERAVAVAAGPGGGFRIAVTADGGRTWSRAALPGPRAAAPGPTLGMGFWNARDGWGLGTPANLDAILETRDGGRTWFRAGSLPGHVLMAAFSGPRRGLAAGTPSTRGMGWAATSDGGRTWDGLRFAGSALAGTLSAPAPGTFEVAVQGPGQDVRLAATSDGGAAWTERPAPAGTAGLAFGTPACGWAVARPAAGAPMLWRTADGGASWTAVRRLGPAAGSVLLSAAGCRGVWLVATARRAWTVWHSADAGRTWRARALPAQVSDAYGGVALASAGRGEAWLLSRTGLWRTQDGGSAWFRIAAP